MTTECNYRLRCTLPLVEAVQHGSTPLHFTQAKWSKLGHGFWAQLCSSSSPSPGSLSPHPSHRRSYSQEEHVIIPSSEEAGVSILGKSRSFSSSHLLVNKVGRRGKEGVVPGCAPKPVGEL